MNDIKKLKSWQIVGVFVIFLLAALWHFVYAWIPSGVSATIFSVNESPWEHVKLLFFPAIIFYLIEYIFIGRKYDNYIFAHGVSIVLMPIMMFILFYGYRLGLKIEENLILDIVITFIVTSIGSLIAYRITVGKRSLKTLSFITPIVILIMFVSYSLLTFFTPHKPVFYDKNTDSYGLEAGAEGHDHNHDDEHEDEDHDDE